ncbi:MAG TPA: hypothetical protein VFF11_15725 [Candidatus Binatia bacterium]|nr:hypothetical protein [Candidatus Binatia bacterium]
MKTQIEVKSVLVGIVIGVLAVFAIGAGTSSSNPIGKYQITGVGNGTGGWAAVVVDTQTGEVWGADFHNNWNDKSSQFWGPK